MIKFLSFLLIFIGGLNSQAVIITGKSITENTVSNYIIYSETEHLIINRMEEIKNRMTKDQTDVNTAFNELIEKAKKGSEQSFSWLIYIFMEKHLKKYAKKKSIPYDPVFSEIHFDTQTDDKLRALIYDSNSKWNGENFILPILNYMFLNLEKNINPQSLHTFKEILDRASLFKDSPIKDFKFFWASLILQYSKEWQTADPHIQANQNRKSLLSSFEHIMGISEEDKKLAKKVIVDLAEDNYKPAQHLISLIYILEKKFDKALPLLEKNKDRFPKSSYTLLPLIYRDVKKDIKTAEALFKTAIYEKQLTVLKPELINIYLSLQKYEEILKILKEMIDEKDRNIFSDELLLNSFEFMIGILLESQNKNKYQQAFHYNLRLQIFAEQLNISLEGGKAIEDKIKSQLSEKEMESIKNEVLKNIELQLVRQTYFPQASIETF